MNYPYKSDYSIIYTAKKMMPIGNKVAYKLVGENDKKHDL